ncbi:MAG: hypothetical protein Q8N60_01960 [Candidatus Diapherotrites archaeon]|nr:hypothetical protein [Candidatus Diapherotrites archaeon]
MTARNSILLIVKQHPGIEYNALLNKVAANYGSIESARAALSRALRYLGALGMIARKENRVFATEKGAALLGNEMRSKLLLRLNDAVKEKNAVERIDSIVEMLHMLIERGKQDADLLKAAKGSVGFYISDLAELAGGIEKRVHNLQYLERVFKQQVDSLKQLDFPERKELLWGNAAKKTIKRIAGKTKAQNFVAQCSNEQFFNSAKKAFQAKAQQNDLFFEQWQLLPFLEFVEKNSMPQRNPINLYLGAIKIRIDYPHISIIGPFKQLNALVEKRM